MFWGIGVTISITIKCWVKKWVWINESLSNSVTLMTWYIKEQTYFASHTQGSTFKQTHYKSRRFWEIQLNQNVQYNNLQSLNWTESCEKVQNNIIKFNPNLVKQKLLYKIQIHQNIRMRQDLNPSPCSWLAISQECERQGNIFLAESLSYTCENDWDWRREVKWKLLFPTT